MYKGKKYLATGPVSLSLWVTTIARFCAWMSDDDGQASPLSLPRDLKLRVCMAMDMDARICCGLVFRLRVPDAVASRISAALKAPTERVRHDGHPTTSAMVCLGSHSFLPGFQGFSGAPLPRTSRSSASRAEIPAWTTS
jgi:hypothetical protein